MWNVFTILTLLFSISLIIFGGFYIYVKHAYTYWSKRGVEFYPPIFPFGVVLDQLLLKKDMATIFKELHLKMKGGFAGIFMFTRPFLLIKDKELLKSILIKDFDHFVDRGIFFDEKTDPLAATLFSINGQKWRNMRHKMSPAFTSGKLKMMFNTICNISNNLDKYLENLSKQENNEIEIRDLSARFLTDVIASIAFGIEIDSIKDPNIPFRQMGAKSVAPTFRNLLPVLFSFMAPKLIEITKIKQVSSDIEEFMLSIIRQTLEYREKNNITREDFIQIMIQLRNNVDITKENNSFNTNIIEEKKMTLEEITAQAFIFFAAGFETSSSTISFCLFELVKKPDLLLKCQQEYDEIMKKHNGILTYETLADMKYIDCCIDETLRKYPPAAFLMRFCTKEYKIPNTDILIEEGTNILISNIGIHHDPEIYPNPENFDPSRFEPENKSKRSAMDYLPFGEGPRNCIGMRLGRLMSKIGLVTILSKYNLKLGATMKDQLVWDPKNFLLFPKDGVKLNITKR